VVSSQPRSSWEKLVVDAGQRLLWRWPLRAATWAGRQLFDRTVPAVTIASLLLFVVTATALVGRGIVEQRWGAPARVAWSNEETARRNVEILSAKIAQRERGAPPRRDLARWREELAELRRQIKLQREYIPSWFLPLAPRQPLPRPWRLFFDVDHFLFHSIYAPMLGLYLLLGIAFGWRRSRRWWRRQWRQGIARSTPEQLFLGLDDGGRAHTLAEDDRSKHLLIAGTTGSGKTEALKLLARHDIACGRGLVFLDMKGDRGLAQSLFASCVEAGRRDDFLYFSLEPVASHSYNPLASGDALAKRDRLINASTWSSELFYKNEAKAVAGRVLAAMASKGAITFDDLYLALDDRSVYAQVARWAAPQDQPKFGRDLQGWPQFWRNLSGLRANLYEFQQLRDRLCVAHADIDFREVHERNRVVYFELNSQMRREVTSSLARLILEDLKHLSGSLAGGAAEHRKPFSIYIDEARNAVYDGFVGFISQCRSAGIGLVLATQSPLDFDGDNEAVTLSVVQNTATKLIFCQRDPKSAQFCAELGGTKDTIKRTAQVVDDGFVFGPLPTGAYSEREVKEFFVHPDALKAINVGRAYLIQGDGARTLVRVRYRRTPPAGAISPTIPRSWHPGDRERLEHGLPPLGLAEPVERRPIASEGHASRSRL
jgi:hypothetical protein